MIWLALDVADDYDSIQYLCAQTCISIYTQCCCCCCVHFFFALIFVFYFIYTFASSRAILRMGLCIGVCILLYRWIHINVYIFDRILTLLTLSHSRRHDGYWLRIVRENISMTVTAAAPATAAAIRFTLANLRQHAIQRVQSLSIAW